MPQPLNKVVPNPKNVTFGSDCAWDREDLATYATTLIASWSQVEVAKSSILAVLISTQPLAAAKIYNAVESASGKKALLKTAMIEVAGEGFYNLFDNLLKDARSAETARNSFAHNIWGICDNLPDALLLLDARYSAVYEAQIANDIEKFNEKMSNTQIFGSEKIKMTFTPIDYSNVSVYKEKELIKLNDDAAKLYRSLLTFTGHLHDETPPSIDQIYREQASYYQARR